MKSVKVIFQKIQTNATAKNAKIACGIIATISVILIGHFLLSSFWFWTSLEITAGALVAGGCWGEWYLFNNPPDEGDALHKSRHRRKELQCIIAVAIGVSVEFLALFHAIPQGARLEKDVAEIGRTNEQLSLQVELLRSNNIVLATKIQHRDILPFQMRKLIEILTNAKNISKIPIKVFIGAGFEKNETMKFAYTINYVMNESGYGDGDVISIPKFSNKGIDPTVQIIAMYSSKIPDPPPFFNSIRINYQLRPANQTNGITETIGNMDYAITESAQISYHPTTNPSKIVCGVAEALNYVGIKSETMLNTNLPNGVCAFFIPEQTY
ncbi:MAG: hypothetical protein ABSC01_07010 [Verrucomicrobiota bacterium]